MPAILIDPAELSRCLDDPAVRLLDATVELPAPRFDGDYRVASGRTGWLAGHIQGALHADLLDDLAEPNAAFSFALPSAERLASGLARLGVSASSRVVIYDRVDGFWAARLWWVLRSVGIAARVLDGGLKAWLGAGHRAQQGEPTVICAPPLTLTPDPTLWIDRQGVQAISTGQRPGTLICALSAALFDGSAPSRYARRGHIPGSRSLPARQLFDAQGRYLPTGALRQAIGPDLLQAPGPLVLYCGGGISAAAPALALTQVGRTDLILYDGSLQEWAADSSLPMTTGATPA